MNLRFIGPILTGSNTTISIVFCTTLLMFSGIASLGGESKAGGFDPSVLTTQPSKKKQTTLGLYVTAAQAYDMWKAAPERVKVIDVRTPEEYAFVGHPEMALNVPYAFVTYQRKNGRTTYGPKLNPVFVAEVEGIAKPTDTIFLTCRSGERAAKAINLLADAGFKNVYNIIDGVEGDKVTDPESVFIGKRMKNGWKNSAPWVYDIDPEKIILEEGDTK